MKYIKNLLNKIKNLFKKKEEVKDDMDYAYFDLERMKEAMSQESIRIPKFDTVEELDEWLNRDDDEHLEMHNKARHQDFDYNIKDLMNNTNFDAQREDETLSKWQGKSRSESVYNVSEKDFDLILEATQKAEEIKFSESPLPKEYKEWLSKQKGVDNRGVKGEGFFDDDELEFLESQKRDKPCENLKSKFFSDKNFKRKNIPYESEVTTCKLPIVSEQPIDYLRILEDKKVDEVEFEELELTKEQEESRLYIIKNRKHKRVKTNEEILRKAFDKPMDDDDDFTEV